MPSIYPNLKKSDRKYIRTKKAQIRREILDVAKQEEMITELYKKMVGNIVVAPKIVIAKEPKKVEKKIAKSKTQKPKVKK